MASALVTRTTTAGKVGEQPEAGLRQRKKARLRQQIIAPRSSCFAGTDTMTPGSTTLCRCSKSASHFFPIFPSKDAVLREVGERGYACIRERLRLELSNQAGTEERLRRLYLTMAREVEGDKKLWQAWCCRAPWIRCDRGIARSRGGCRQFAARNSDARAEARRGDPSISGCAPGRIHGRTLQHGGAAMGRGFDRAAQAHGSGTERGRVFFARHPALSFLRSECILDRGAR